MSLIKPHGAEALTPRIVSDQRKLMLEGEVLSLPSITVSSAAAANAVMLGAGYFTPLAGYMNRDDAMSVASELKTTEGSFGQFLYSIWSLNLPVRWVIALR